MNSAASARYRLAGVTLAGILASALVLRAADPPPALPLDAPTSDFSAERARVVLARLLDGVEAHPVGSHAHALVRDRVRHEFVALGLVTEVESALTLTNAANVVWVENVVARLAGAHDDHPVIVCAHYDSVGAGPGASDDGAGVAALVEIARALRGEGQPENDIVFLVTDGEEAGLAGAVAYSRAHPDVHATIVNLEARGTSGRSFLFETSEDARGLLQIYGRTAAHPSATSVSFEIYQRMPNDTDFSVFKQRGDRGLNFAFVDGFRRYHTPLDDLAHLDVRSLQHQGEQVLGVVRELARTDPAALAHGQSVYFDVLGTWFVSWPVGASRAAAIVLLLAWALFLTRAVRAGRTTFRGVVLATLTVLLIVLVAALASALFVGTLLWPSWIEPGRLDRLARLALPTFVLTVLVTWTAARSRALGRLDGNALARGVEACAVLAALATAFTIPGASYVFLIGACVPLVLDTWHPTRLRFGVYQTIPSLFALTVLVLPLARGIELAFPWNLPGAGAPVSAWLAARLAVLVPVAWIAVQVAPLARSSERAGRTVTVALASSVILGVALIALPSTPTSNSSARSLSDSSAHPSWLSLVHVDRARGASAVRGAMSFGGVYPPLVDVGGALRANQEAPLAWFPRILPGRALEVPRSSAPEPTIEVLSDGRATGERRLRARVASQRAATNFALRIPSTLSVQRVLANGGEVAFARGRRGTLLLSGIDARGFELEFVAALEGEDEIEVADIVSGLPPEGDTLARSRPEGFVPRGLGDVWIVATIRRL